MGFGTLVDILAFVSVLGVAFRTSALKTYINIQSTLDICRFNIRDFYIRVLFPPLCFPSIMR